MPLICQFKKEYKCFILIYFNYNGCIVYITLLSSSDSSSHCSDFVTNSCGGVIVTNFLL